ncbi:MAG: cytochrome-c peroxidase [Ferruginibacter sp.]|nr:cytochrome-c peroxidase [Ferruginibacter sp.]
MKKYIILITTGAATILMLASFIDEGPLNKAELGKLLFFDPLLSKDSTISCASCHKPAFAFADTTAVSIGVGGQNGSRNTPSSMNVSLHQSFFWDGRAKSLEEQALAPIENPAEMNLPVAEAVIRLQNNARYATYFKKIFNNEPTSTNLAEALASFERTLETSESPFDEWKFSDNPNAVSDAVKRGFDIFNNKGKCIQCHFGADLTANEFRNIGLFNGKELNDSGRMVISGKKEDIGKFKTSSLRNIAITAPYMHNGMFKTLKEVIDFYNDPGKVVNNSVNRDSILGNPFGLTSMEKSDLEAFLISLTDKRFSTDKGGR